MWLTSEKRRAKTDLRTILPSLRKAQEGGGTSGHAHGEEIGLLAIDGDLLGVDMRGIKLDLRTLEAAVSLAEARPPKLCRYIEPPKWP